MITFIHPYAFVWLLLAIPLLLFYLWPVRPTKVETTTGVLWQRALPLIHPRRAWQPWRWVVSLVVQLLVLLVLVTALAEPCWRRPQRIALVLDGTSSMSVQDADGRTRQDKAMEKARELVARLGYNDSMAVIAVADEIQIVSRMSNNREAIAQLLEPIQLGHGKASIQEAVSMAVSLITAASGGEFDPETNHVVLLSDGCFPHADSVLADEKVSWIPVGTSVGNVELENVVASRRNTAAPEEFEILVTLENYSDAEVSGSVSLKLDDQPFATEVLKIPAAPNGGRWTHIFTGKDPREHRVTAEFSTKTGDALLEDNLLETTLPEAFCYQVTLISRGERNALLREAFETLPEVRLISKFTKKERIQAISCQEGTTPKGVRQYPVVVYDRVLPEDFESENMAGARVIFIAPPAASPLWERAEETRDYVVMPWLDGWKNGVSVAGVGFNETHRLTPKVASVPWLFSQSALQVAEAPAAGEEENYAKGAKTVAMTELVWGIDTGGSGVEKPLRAVLVSCDLTKSDWLLSDSFPRFLRYSLDWLAGSEASRKRIQDGFEPEWNVADNTRDCNLNVPPAPEKVFRFPGEDVVPLWLILVTLLVPLMMVEWALYQRRWME
ncbi:MAG: vWA domain-containing protein [Planctomycetia bacterium]|nr:vWA domain-containing protein [Planctomycetia bacterium]